MSDTRQAIGLCLGASTISVVRLQCAGDLSGSNGTPIIADAQVHPHEGHPKQTLLDVMDRLALNQNVPIAVTGRKFRHQVRLSSIPEPQAVEYAYRFVQPADMPCPAIISAGGETFMVYVLNRSGQIVNVITGNKCASGTGEFFLQQLRRMNLTVDQAARYAAETEPYPVSGRCSVFCKSDCTHATNKGIERSRVTAGLCRMMAEKILSLLKHVSRRRLMLVGGTAQNRMMVHHLESAVDELIVPHQAPYFEALGAALWALDHPTRPYAGPSQLFSARSGQFDTLPPLSAAADLVTFKTMATDRARTGDTLIIGLDVGSTTTKAVLVRPGDHAMVASVYLRTNGDPVGASRQCYRELGRQLAAQCDPATIAITGLGVCGSGRQIAGLHALTDGVINEIVAHATAAVYFDAQVDTIFEIGGQDAKYTYITSGVPSDYAMNEACSAGTGSFLEESALESLGLAMEKIAPVALKGNAPPNFNDQCAAFIASDIKNAIHEGIAHQDIVAGLIYSICMNYNNRVKGNRPVGRKIFMQGGVCYNQAVPMAMATLTGKPIIVPPEPGLMGAFGAALVVEKRTAAGLMAPAAFDLTDLCERDLSYGRPFTCKGGAQKCDRRCEIARIQIDGRQYPFGGACNRYDNLRHNRRFDVGRLDLVHQRQKLIFDTYAPVFPRSDDPGYRGRIGLNKSFLVNTYYPLYAHFFSRLGFAVTLPEKPSKAGRDRCNAPFCYPAELAHGFFDTLIDTGPELDYLFLPHFRAVPSMNGDHNAQVCPFVQGEPFYLSSAFRDRLRQIEQTGTKILSPLIDLSHGLEKARNPLIRTAVQMGARRTAARRAFDHAMAQMKACQQEMQAIGSQVLDELAGDPDQIAVVILARPYNGFVDEAHMGIPHKFATRGIRVLPLDFLPLAGQPGKDHMYWGMGQRILMAGHLIRRHPQLFATYVTNFSCGPDSFIIGYFREQMGRKPSLTLELDSHTADAGLETRIEAFLDIVNAYRQLERKKPAPATAGRFQPARVVQDKNGLLFQVSGQSTTPLTDARVTLLFPSMGAIATEALAASFRSAGFHTCAHEPSDAAILKLGRGHTTCKECLPLILTTGTLLDYLHHRKQADERVLYFMPTGSGPCRFGQYAIFMQDLIKRLKLPDVAVFSLSSDLGYEGLPTSLHRRAWWAVVVSDVMEDMRAMLLANAEHREKAQQVFGTQWQQVIAALETGRLDTLIGQLAETAAILAKVPLKRPADQVPTIALTGEIFVRRDGLSRQYLTEYLADKGFATRCAPVAEWIHYSNYMANRGIAGFSHRKLNRINALIKQQFMHRDEQQITTALAASGLIQHNGIPVEQVVATASRYISPQLAGEAVLTVGSSLKEVVTHSCGVIAIGPFGCMPNRLSEALLHEAMTRKEKLASDPHNRRLRTILEEVEELPFLAIESDGSPYPQLIHARLEAFCLQARRLHRHIQANGPAVPS